MTGTHSSRCLRAPWRSRTVGGALAIAILVALAGASCGGGSSRAGRPDGLTDIGAGLQGPSGLHAAVFAQGLPNVAALAFDTEGRLWAATAAFQDSGDDAVYLVPSQGAAPLKVLSGRHTVLGLLWRQGSLYVASKERVDAYAGFDGARFATQRTVVQFPAGVGEVNGLAASPEGRIVLGISAPCNACDPALEMSGAVVSFLPDGSDLRVDARDIRAPIALAYNPGTGDLYVTMNQRDDLGDATPGDWIALVHPGQSWGFPGCYGQGGAACAGVPAPVAALDPHAAVSGIAIVQGDLGSVVGPSAIVAEWATGKVLAVSLAPQTYGSVSTFLLGLHNPVPVALGPTGALYLGDWTAGIVYQLTAG